MRKFKHKITGYIATETNSEKNYKVSEPKNFTIPKWIVEDSGDWEEIKEFPKIISYRSKSDNEYIYDNPEYFNILKDDKWEIYQIAISETEVFTLRDRVTYNYRTNYSPWIIDNFFIRADGKILARSKSNSICEIVSEIKKAPEPLFITEDNVEIFDGDTVYYVRKDSKNLPNEVMEYRNYCGLYSDLNIYFSTKKAAEDWLAKNKPKDLQYYEDLLLNPVETVYTFCTFSFSHYTWLKNKEPKLYWLKVLELVQQDLDDGWKPNWNDTNPKYIIKKYKTIKYNVEIYNSWNFGLCNFKSEKSAQKAIELMGDKLDIIFK